MERIKPLIPSLREKKRYLAFEIISKEQALDFQDASVAIMSSLKSLYGTKGQADAGVIFIKNKYSSNAKKGVLRVNNKYLDKLRLALAMIKEIQGKKVIIKSLTVSGMLKKAAEKVNA